MPYYYETNVYRHPSGAIIQRVVRYDTATGKPVKERHYAATTPINEKTGKCLNLDEYFSVRGSQIPKRKYKMRKNYIYECNYDDAKVRSGKTRKMAKS